MVKVLPQHQARPPGDIIVLPRVTVHGGTQPAAGVEDVCLADLGLAHGFLGNVIPFRRLKPSQTATPDCVVSLETRPAPLLPRLSSRSFWLALAVTVAAHAVAFAVFLREPPPLASIGVEAVSVELVIGDNRMAGNGEVTSESQITDTAPPAPEVADKLMQPPEQSEKTSEAVDKPAELAAVEPEQKIEQPAPQPVEEKAEAQPEPQIIVEEALQKATEPEKPAEKPAVTAAIEPETPKPVDKIVEPPVKPAETKTERKKPVETKKPVDTKKKQEAKAKPTDKPANHERAAAPAASQQLATRGIGIGQSSNNTNYTSLVRGHLMRHRAAYSGRGVATVEFALSGSGAVTSVRLASSSGDPKLDEIAISMVRSASPFPASPDGRSNKFSLPIKPN